MTYKVQNPQHLTIVNDAGSPFYGGSQYWYKRYMQRLSGCGPTTASHLLYYLARTRENCAPLVPEEVVGKQGFLSVMEESWKFVTPGMQGVNSTRMFRDGVERFGKTHGVNLRVRTLEIPKERSERPSPQMLFHFLESALEKDLPVAFLNLDNGKLSNLEKWHWVTLVECDSENQTAVMYDQGRRVPIDLGLWLETTKVGGGLVTVEPLEQ